MAGRRLTPIARANPLSFTDACEAPVAVWKDIFPLKVYRASSGKSTAKCVYEHPKEVSPLQLSLHSVNSMYCIGNGELCRTFPEGLGGKVMQLFVPGHPRGFLYRRQSHLLNRLSEKLVFLMDKREVVSELLGKKPGIIFDGETGIGKSALLCQAVHFLRSRGVFTIYVPNAKVWTHGEWCWPSILLRGFFDVPDAGRNFLHSLLRAHGTEMKRWPLYKTPSDLPVQSGAAPKTLYDLCRWGCAAPAPTSIDEQSVALMYFFEELRHERKRPIVFVIDGMNLFASNSHFRYPHPDFLRSMNTLSDTDMDMYPQEFPRIPASRLSFVRGLNCLIEECVRGQRHNAVFICGTTRDFRSMDGLSGFPDVERDRDAAKLDEYGSFDAAKDTFFHPITVDRMDEYEYRSFLRFLINSGELAGLGWGPWWHHSSSFERKLYKIEFLSERNPQRVVDQYHGELVWRHEYQRIRQKQYLLQRKYPNKGKTLRQ